MRMYEPVWLTLKANLTATVQANPAVHRRIVIAVRKEKYKDIGFKLLCSERNIRYKLEEVITGELITFTLIDHSPVTLEKL